MNKEKNQMSNDLNQLADDARALLGASAGAAGEKVGEARVRLAAALDRGRRIYDDVLDREAANVRAVDGVMHEHPYEAIAIGVGVGALIGYLVALRCICRRGQ